MISRDWQCLNDKCRAVFHSWDHGNPPCPECGCVRVDWVPGGGHIMGMAPRVDRNLRAIADQHGLTNLNSPSPSRLNRAAPRAPIHPQVPGYSHQWGALGVSTPIADPYHPNAGAICVSAPINMPGKVQIGQKRDSKWLPGPEANARIMRDARDRRS